MEDSSGKPPGAPHNEGAAGEVPSSLGPFLVERELGRGGSAIVYAARRDGARGPLKLALKVERELGSAATRERFVEEAERLARIAHPSIVRVHEAGELPDGRAYLAMDLLEGETIAARIERGPMPLEESLRVFASVASAVSALHEAGLVHRDIKAENVMLVGDPPSPVLLDLGIAKETNAEPSTTTREGVVRGTPATMAPERFFGQPATVASDVYELGVLLYAMLLGRLPWDDGSDVDERLAAKPPRELDQDIPAAVSDAIMEALISRPARRPVSVKALAERVLRSPVRGQAERSTAALDARPSRPNDTPGGTAVARESRTTGQRKRAFLPALALAVLAVGAGATVTALRHDPVRAAAPPDPTFSADEPAGPALSDTATVATSAPGAPSSAVAIEPSPPAVAPSGSSAASQSPPASSTQPANASAVLSLESFPSCKAYVETVCAEIERSPAPVHFLPGLCWKGELQKRIDKASATERPKIDADCKKQLDDHNKRAADQTKANESIEGQLPACKAWVDKSCSPDVKRRKATSGFCSWNTHAARDVALNRPKEADRLCQKELDNWDNAVDAAVEKSAHEDEPLSRPYVFLPP